MIVVLGHRGMLGRRVMERYPSAEVIEARFTGDLKDPLLAELDRIGPDWVIDCIGATDDEPDMWAVNAMLPHRIGWPLVQAGTDHHLDATEYARSKRLGETGNVIRCAIVDPDGGTLARAREQDTFGSPTREWNGITARSWARLAEEVVEGRLSGAIVPGSPTISHFDMLETARRVFGWTTRTKEARGMWFAPRPRIMLPHIEDQLREYL